MVFREESISYLVSHLESDLLGDKLWPLENEPPVLVPIEKA